MKNPIKQLHSDRFIPVRCQSAPKNTMVNRLANNQSQCKETLKASVVSKRNQLTFSKSLSTRGQSIFDFLSSLPKSCKATSKRNKPMIINCQKIIDVPGIVDNFYYNTFDISLNDFVGIGISSELHMFRQTDNEVISFQKRKSDSLISCVKFSPGDEVLMSSDEDGFIEIHDIDKVKTLRIFKKHAFRVGRLETDSLNHSIFYSGSKDYKININDLRQKYAVVSSLVSQKSQICGLNLKDNYLASGMNDGSINIWDVRSQKLLQTLNHHNGAVKALSWCPWRSNILVSGGGKKDSKIVIYDMGEKKIENALVINHQISDLCWRRSTQQLIYSYNKEGKGTIKVHNYFNPRCQTKKLPNHAGRIINLAVNKRRDNMTYSLSADETIMYWNLDNVPNKINAPDVMNSNFQLQ